MRFQKVVGCLTGAAALFTVGPLTMNLYEQFDSFGDLILAAWWIIGLGYAAFGAHRRKPDWIDPAWFDDSDGRFFAKMAVRAFVWPFYLGGQLGCWVTRWAVNTLSAHDVQLDERSSA